MPVLMKRQQEEKEEQDVRKLMEILEKGAIYDKLQAASTLGRIGEPAVPSLMDAINSENPNLRWRAAIALGKMGTPAVDPLIDVLESRNASVRVPVTWALAEIGDARAVPPLLRVLREDQSECCRVMAGAALLKIGDPEGVSQVIAECRNQGEEFAGQVREAYYGT
jgi:HEAT repeat protein